MEKKEIRSIIRSLKKLIIPNINDISTMERNLFSKVEMLHEFSHSRNILMYHSLSDEFPTTSTLELWQSVGKHIFLPRVNGNNLEIVRYQPGYTHTGAYGTTEPSNTDETATADMIDLIIVPAIAFDPNGNRLGRGKGFYDRLFTQSQAVRIGVCFDFQLLDDIPTEPHDVPMHIVVTPSTTINLHNTNKSWL